MNFVGIALHKKTISLCVVNQERKVLNHRAQFCITHLSPTRRGR